MLVTEFYRHLSDPSLNKAEALQQAQISLLKDNRYRHPGYWAAFLLIGNWL
jgi:CHAT domain-containing protein